ncbi:MAG: PLDc N-terminal domain-containing protein [Deltaproteobacteria bacterium]|nr:PLDc N-terminal domain-containing protein [Deltaproteobacteria bacterium]
MDFRWLLVHLLPSLGFILALALLSHILRERRPPTSTLAWLMAIIFIPYLGVPLYLIFGGRKMLDKAGTKPELAQDRSRPLNDAHIRDAVLLEPDSGISPPSANNRVTFLFKGEQAFETIVDLIHQASHSIFVATFILGKDETGSAIVHALAEKASQGLTVCLLLDALGSVRISQKFLSPLLAAGGHVAFFMPMIHLPFRGRANLRNHRKMLICDNRSAIIGGMNLASEYMGPKEVAGRWQDLSLLVQGPVIDHITDVFRSDWKFASKTLLDDHATTNPATRFNTRGVTQLVASGPDVRNDSLRNAILTEIFRAERRIWVMTPYFVPDEMLLEALCIAVRRNVDVSIIIPKKSNHRLADLVREGYLTRLQESGADVWLYEPRMLHAKAILVDDSLAMVGSANMDMRSLLLNYEIALCLYDADAIGQLEAWMLDLIRKDCSARQRQPKRSFGLIESVGRLFAPLL